MNVLVDYICRIVIFHIYLSVFDSTLMSFCKPQSILDIPTLRQGCRERKNATQQFKDMTLVRIVLYIHTYMYTYIYVYLCVDVLEYVCMCIYGTSIYSFISIFFFRSMLRSAYLALPSPFTMFPHN